VEADHVRRIHGGKLAAVLTGLLLSLLLPALDQTIVGVAMPKIVGSLSGFDRYGWVVTAYLLGSTMLLPMAGRLSDQFGRKGFLVGGTFVFLVASALCGQAASMNELIAWRGLQGLAAGVGITLVFTVIADIFPIAERAKWQGLFGAVYGFSSIVGPTLGGWLADHGPPLAGFVDDATRWRWAFYINLPIGAVALALLLAMPSNLSERVTRETGWAAVRRIDIVGAGLSAAATVLLMLALTWVSQDAAGWQSARVVEGLIGAAALYAAFLAWERRTKAEPVLPLSLLGERVYGSIAAVAFLNGVVLLTLIIFLPLYLQSVLHSSASGAGIAILPLTVAATIGAIGSGAAMSILGRYRAVATVSAVVLCVAVGLISRMDAATPLLHAEVLMAVAGLALGVFFPITTAVPQAILPRAMMGIGTNAVTYVRTTGQLFGVAVFGSILHGAAANGGPDALARGLQNGFLAIAVAAGLTVVAVRFARDVSITGTRAGSTPPG
jgi:EmrB/QacA subfamily drug resistance transporter